MTTLDAFALLVLVVLFLAVFAGWVMVGMFPGRIARQRKHPQAAAINVCGWFGALTLGILTPIAFIWAYTNPRWREGDPTPPTASSGEAAK
jgi:uncharacterized membrane protein